MAKKLTQDVLRSLSEAWLTQYGVEQPTYNPLEILRTDDNIEFEKKLAWLLIQPDYFAFLVKHVFNIDLLPFQVVILTELWQRKFPMLIATRGASKTFLLALYALMRALLMPGRRVVIAGAGFRQSKFVHEYMMTIWNNAPILRDLCDDNSGPKAAPDVCRFNVNTSTINALPIGDGSKIRGYRSHDLLCDEFACMTSDAYIQTDEGIIQIKDYLQGDAYDLINMDGELETPDRIFKTPKVDVYHIKSENGYNFKCSAIHQVMTRDGWKLAKDLTPADYLVLDVNKYFPTRYIKQDEVILDERLGWLLGLLISEGTVTNRNYVMFTNTDKELIDKVIDFFPEITWVLKERPAYVDKRGFNCKTSWNLTYSSTEFRSLLYKFGVTYEISLGKTVPKGILQSPKSVVVAFLSGLFEGDGSCFYYDDNGKQRIGVTYYTGSEALCDELHILLLKFGITCPKIKRQKNVLSKNRGFMLSMRGSNALQIYKLINVLKWKDKFDTAYFYERKPSISVVTKKTTRYNVSTTIGNKNKHIGSFGSREEAVQAFNDYVTNERPLFKVKSVELLPEQQHLYDFHLPKTHSFIGNGFIQHNSHIKEIFETVLSGFGNVAANPVEAVKRTASIEMAKDQGYDTSSFQDANPMAMSNQIVISGTAYYSFNHFYEYWMQWKKIINSKGNKKELENIFNGEIPKGFDWKDYSVIRIPYSLLPKGFMDEGNVARSKASVHSGIYLMEYEAVFQSDSQGFFKRSTIEKCVANEINRIIMSNGPVIYDAVIKGEVDKQYVIGIDPASERDNFSVVVLELHGDHRRVVHCWTTTRQSHIEKVKLGLTTEDNFYSYCARRIRDLMRVFPTSRLMLDSQGGGISISESLHETSNLKENELQIWPVIEEKYKDSDDKPGLHIIEMVNFASAEWTSQANHSLRKDIEDKVLLFPKFDPIVLGLAAEQDAFNNKLYDTLEDCVWEIEELKSELSIIELTKTANGRDHFDTPDMKVGQNKKQKMRKDRYSSLLMANAGARAISLVKEAAYESYGGFSAQRPHDAKREEVEYIGPLWWTNGIRGVY